MKTPKSAPSMAASKSASAKKMLGDFPPSSSVTRFTVSAACFHDDLADSRIPVNAILLTSGCWTMGAPQVSPKPVTTLTTPVGSPQSAKYFANSSSSQRRLFRGLEDTSASRGDGGSQLPRSHQHRVIPGNNLSRNSDRLLE